MKKFTMLMMATLTILSASVFAQDTTKISTATQKHITRSKKELMKMEIMKTDTSSSYTNIKSMSSGENYKNNNKSKKEQMKMEVMKIDNSSLYPKVKSHKPAKCSICITNRNRSKKEQMKMEVMKIQTCSQH